MKAFFVVLVLFGSIALLFAIGTLMGYLLIKLIKSLRK